MSRRDEWSPRLDLRPLLTPISDCVRLKLGLAHQDVVDKLEAGQFDQAPVVDGHGKVVGIIDTLVLRQRTHIGEPIRLSDCRTTWLPPSTDMETTLSELLDSRSFLVRKKDGPCLGLVSVSDLNHHEFRVAVYSLLSRLEVQLAHVVRQSFQDPWDWIKFLPADSRAAVVGYWEIGKRSGVDIGPAASLTLSQLISIICSADDLFRRMEFRSKKELRKLLGEVPDVRNRIMHPVRPLVLDHADVETMIRVVNAARAIGVRSERLLGVAG